MKKKKVTVGFGFFFMFTEFPFIVFSSLDLNGTFVLKLKQQYNNLYLVFRHGFEMNELKH